MRKVERHTATDGTITYRVRFRHGGKQTSQTFHGPKLTAKRQAEAFAKTLDAVGVQAALRILEENQRASDVPTLDALAAEYIRDRSGISEGTRIDYQRLWDRTWGQTIGTIRADLITDEAIERAVQSLAKHYSYKSMENQRGLLSGVCRRAVKRGYLAENPTSEVGIPRQDETEEMTFLTPAEFDLLLTEIPDWWKPLVIMLAGTGMRWGEAVALLGRDVKDGTVNIVKAVKRDRSTKERVIGPPKTKRSRRTVLLPAQVAAALPDRPPAAVLFVGPRGSTVKHQHFWENVWRPAVWRAQHCDEHTLDDCRCGGARLARCKVHKGTPPPPCGCPGTLGKTPRIHDLRHSHASWLIAANVPPPVIQRRLGHESITTTVDTYGHLMPDAQQAAAAAAELVFAPLQLEA